MVTKGRNDGLKEIPGDIFELLPLYEKFFVFKNSNEKLYSLRKH